MREAVPLKERHEWVRKWLQTSEIRLQGTLPADGVAEEGSKKVQHLILAEATTHEVYLVGQRIE
jgi:hypothetical protein